MRGAAHACLQVLINGILLGGLYGLMALGLALVWGVLNIVNLAHGALIMLGGYVVYYLFTFAASTRSSACRSPVIMFGFGYALQRAMLNQIVRSALLNTLLITFGLEVVLTYLAQLVFCADFRTINPAYAGATRPSSAITMPQARLAAFGVAWRWRRCCGSCCAPAARPRHPRHGAEPRGGAALRRRPAPSLRDDLRYRRRAGWRCRRALRHHLPPDAVCRRHPDGEVVRDRHHRRPRQSVRA